MATASKPRKTAVRTAAKATVKPARKSPGKSSVRPASRPAAKSPARPRANPAAAASTTAVRPKADKPRKPKLVRDSFTIPKSEFTVLQELKQRAGRAGTAAKKSEILRAGIKALAAMNDAAFAAALGAVPPIKTGRPAKE